MTSFQTAQFEAASDELEERSRGRGICQQVQSHTHTDAAKDGQISMILHHLVPRQNMATDATVTPKKS